MSTLGIIGHDILENDFSLNARVFSGRVLGASSWLWSSHPRELQLSHFASH